MLERGRRDHPGLGRIIPERFKVLDNDAAMVETAPRVVVELGVGRPGLFVVAVVSGLAMVRFSCGGVGRVAKGECGALGLAPQEVVEVEAVFGAPVAKTGAEGPAEFWVIHCCGGGEWDARVEE